MNEKNFVFIHEHEAIVATAKKISDTCYSLDGYVEYKSKDTVKLPDSNIYIYISCKTCDQSIFKTKYPKEFVVSGCKKMKGLKNILNEKGKIEGVYLEDNPQVNLLNTLDYTSKIFYRCNGAASYDKNTIYIGTEDEQKEYFHQTFIDLKQKYEILEKENKDNILKLQQSRQAISFQRDDKDDGKLKDAYHIIIGANSILSLNDMGWEIKYPKTKEEYLKEIEKKMYIVGVVGNRNKGKSFILGKLTDYDVPQGFSIKTEGISVCFGDREDHCIAILDSAGQEVPLLNNAINSKINKVEDENKQLNEIREENDIEKKEGKVNDKAGLLEKCLRDKLITEKFLEEFIIHTSDILILVVGNITLNEQKILTRIKNSLKNVKYLYVVHNLQNFQYKNQVEDYIENTLKKLYGIEIEENNFQNINGDYHKKYYVEKDSKVTHLIFVNDYCDIKDYYNTPTIEFLKKNLDVVQSRTYFSVIEKCKEFFLKLQGDFLEENITKEDFAEVDNMIKINKKNIKLKKVFIDEIGKTIANDLETPNFYYYTEKNDLIVNVELPGPDPNIRTKIETNSDFYNIIFLGEKAGNTSDSKEKHIISKNLKDKTPFKFSILISKKDITILPNDKGFIQFYERSEKNDQGIFSFKYHIASLDGNGDFE